MAGERQQYQQQQHPSSSSTEFRVLVDRCSKLEQSQAELRDQFCELSEKKAEGEDTGEARCAGYFSGGIPYRRILESVGHAVHVRRASSGDIIYWNHAAEYLYGWKDYEVIGYRTDEILVAEEHWMPYLNIMERLNSGQSWSGLFPFKKKSGEKFMAMVTKTPLYETGKLLGVISVSSDASLVHGLNWENVKPFSHHASGLPRPQGFNLNRIAWNPQPPIPPVPQLASSVSRLASKVLSRKSGETTHCSSLDGQNDASEAENDILEKPGKLAAKFLEKLNIGGTRSNAREQEISSQCGTRDDSRNTNITFQPNNCMALNASSLSNGNVYPRENEKTSSRSNCVASAQGKYPHRRSNEIPASVETPTAETSLFCGKCNQQHEFAREAEEIIIKTLEIRNEAQDVTNVVSSGGDSIGSHGSSSSKGDNELSTVLDCEIHWEDLQIGEEIGQGSYAVVYRGIWKGSDVAVKVFFGNEYSEIILQDYKKEIDIMKRLRHPNVLLFMGAIYSPERLGIVTEFLPRGSLFKTLHKNGQALDLRRRLRMALDVARGMNYLHHRNPPIVHRDLKSSNLLVDRNWTVKVADFGLSRFKNSTLLTTKSGRGTPQWMAPEVLRNEPLNEKSDVFSFGVILWELVTQSIPWFNLNSLQVVGIVGFMDRRLDLPEGIDPHAASLINDCWKSDPNQRPSFEEILTRMTGLVRRAAQMSGRRNSDS